jgi:hypothetical protein
MAAPLYPETQAIHADEEIEPASDVQGGLEEPEDLIAHLAQGLEEVAGR